MNRWVAALRLTGIGFYIAACILIGIFVGTWLGNRLNPRVLFVIGGMLLGLAMAVFGVYRMIQPFLNNKGDKGND
jgi:ATP synthase protein I